MIKLPRYTRPIRLKSGQTAFYWELPPWARPDKNGVPKMRDGRPCPVESAALGTDIGLAKDRADILNETLDAWRTGIRKGPEKGTVSWLFDWYQEQDQFKKNKAITRKEYTRLMLRLAEEKMKFGTFGQRSAALVTASAADALYKIWLDRNGKRQATYAMQVCRLVWNWAARHHDVTGVQFNPFAKMRLSTKAAVGNRPTTRAEYDLYRKTARDMGYQSMATAAALCFELCQRVWDAFGFVDEDGKERRGFRWSDYHPGESITVIQSKTGKEVPVPLSEMVDGEPFPLFPTLEEELSRTERKALVIVVDEKTGLPLTYDAMNKRHREICDRAKLPKKMTFTGFRHGGITELGDAGVDDVRPISGHITLNTTAIYNKANQVKAVRAARARLAHLSE
ncbi:tyrosine-type recombinase/integrase [Sphingopyxis flava]|uniref:Phage integrase family protein n=1 Tax=Sphingopyxis flava TaxID=1507287 RepID=A0A1T5ADB7_9SPHN|nr:tyrosine-type recombinase/integrase [Sphingopyxis flava]SKB32895.1 Phage integrase family protein [Sphingopyxis flava]